MQANRNRKLETSTARAKARSREPAYSKALKITSKDRCKDPESQEGRQTVKSDG